MRVELKGIVKRFGAVRALDDVSLAIESGERVALVGENGAGKSSLMNILYGLYQPDAGSIPADGQQVRMASPAKAMAHGLGMVHQHFKLVPTLSVVENVVLGREPTRLGFVDSEAAEAAVKRTAARLGFAIEPRASIASLSVGAQQRVEIIKALHQGARVLVLDEPTAVLSPLEAKELFRVVDELSAQGVTVVLVSHRVPEVLAFASRVVVMRRGKKVAEVAAAETTPRALAGLMVDAEVPVRPPRVSALGTEEAPLLRLERISAGPLKELSLAVRPGEVLGVAGVDGNGQRELALVATGLMPIDEGALEVLGATGPLSARALRGLGVAHLPENRLAQALVPELSVEENVALGHETRAPFARGPFVDFDGRRAAAEKVVAGADVRPKDVTLRAGALSGGNQQKLVVGRELERSPRLVVAVHPTRGLDVAAVAEVRRRLLEVAQAGGGVLLISLDLEEVLALSDTVAVLFDGRLTLLRPRAEVDEASLSAAMLGATSSRPGLS